MFIMRVITHNKPTQTDFLAVTNSQCAISASASALDLSTEFSQSFITDPHTAQLSYVQSGLVCSSFTSMIVLMSNAQVKQKIFEYIQY